MMLMMMMIAIAWASLQLFKSNVKKKQKHDVSMTSGLHQTMAAYKDAASKFTMEPLEPFKRVSHICFSCSIWPFWGSLQRLFRKLAVCSKQCWRSRFGGFLKWRYRKSSKSLDHDLVLEAMVTTGDPFFSGPPSVAFHQEFNMAGRSSVELDDSPGSIGVEKTLLSWHPFWDYLFVNLSWNMSASVPIGSMVLVYMLTWLGYIDGIHVTIYSIHGSYGVPHQQISETWAIQVIFPMGGGINGSNNVRCGWI